MDLCVLIVVFCKVLTILHVSAGNICHSRPTSTHNAYVYSLDYELKIRLFLRQCTYVWILVC